MMCFVNRFMIYALMIFLTCPKNIFLSGGLRGTKFQPLEEKTFIIDEYNDDDETIEVFGEDNNTEEEIESPDLLNMMNTVFNDSKAELNTVLLGDSVNDASVIEIEDQEKLPDILVEVEPEHVIIADGDNNIVSMEFEDIKPNSIEVTIDNDQFVNESIISPSSDISSDELNNNLDDLDADNSIDSFAENNMPNFSLMPIASQNLADDQDDDSDDNDEDIEQDSIVLEEDIIEQAPDQDDQDDQDIDQVLDIELIA